MRPVADYADCELAAGDELLDENVLRVPLDLGGDGPAQVPYASHDVHAHRRRLHLWLYDGWELEAGGVVAGRREHPGLWGGYAVLLQDHLGEGLVLDDGVRLGPRPDVGYAEHFEHCRHVRVPVAPLYAVRHVEDHARPLAGDDARHEAAQVVDEPHAALDDLYGVAASLERAGDLFDGLDAVVLARGGAEHVDDVAALDLFLVVYDGDLQRIWPAPAAGAAGYIDFASGRAPPGQGQGPRLPARQRAPPSPLRPAPRPPISSAPRRAGAVRGGGPRGVGGGARRGVGRRQQV